MARRKPTPEEKSALSRAAAIARWHPEQTAQPAPAKRGRPVKLPGKCSYDRIVGRPLSYQDAVQREKAIAAEMDNEKLREEAEIRRKKLYTAEQVEKRDEAMDEIILSQFVELVQFVGSLVPPEQGTAARAKAQAWVDQARQRIAAAIEAAGT